MLPRSFHVVAVCLPLLAMGCVSSGVQPGTGDVSFRLRWQGTADLDLHVEDPKGRHTSMLASIAVSSSPEALAEAHARLQDEIDEVKDRGIPDIDCNSAPDKICAKPIENIYWPDGLAPAGTYRVWVHLFQQLREPIQIPFVIEVRRGERVVEIHRGVVDNDHRESEHFVYEYQPMP